MDYSFHPEAEEEFLEAIANYDARSENLGYEFAFEVYSTIEGISANPKAWPILEGEVRRRQTTRFPYGVLYIEEKSDIFILAVMHLHRNPDYWKHRLPEPQN